MITIRSLRNYAASIWVPSVSAKEALAYTTLALVNVVFLTWYASAILPLPIFGDGTTHAYIAKQFLEQGFISTTSPFPPLYHALGALFMAVGGDTGFKLLTVSSIGLLSLAVFLFAREISRSLLVGLLSGFIALISPKTIFYSGRMYMEPLLAALIVLTAYFLLRYVRQRRTTDIVLVSLSAGLAILTKQQGLVILLPALVMFFLAEGLFLFLQRKAELRRWLQHMSIFAVIVLALVLPALFWQFHNTGQILPETRYTTWANDIGRWVVDHEDQTPAWQLKWDPYLDEHFVSGGFKKLGFTRAEARHIWPGDVFTSADTFFSVHAPFLFRVGWEYPKGPTIALLALFTVGAAVWLWRTRREHFLVFLILLFGISYLSFIRNTDQLRYHLYIPYLLAFLIPFALHALASRLGWQGVKNLLFGVLAILLTIYALSYFPERMDQVSGFARGQAYSPSQGGMPSVVEVSRWMRDHSEPEDQFYAVPDAEFRYYSDREGIFDFRLYFLPETVLEAVISDMGVKYIILMDSIVVPDTQWTHVGWAPESFVSKIERLYSAAYVSSFGDITVYAVSGPTGISGDRAGDGDGPTPLEPFPIALD